MTQRWHRRSARFGVVALLASVVALGATAGTASAAAPPYLVGVGIDSATITTNGGPTGNCTWLVNASVGVTNTTASSVTVAGESGPAGRVSWSNATNSGVVTPNVTMTWPSNGVVLAGQTLDTTATATFTIPCAATSGDLAIDFVITDQSGHKTTLSGDAQFLIPGTEVPVYAGVAGLVFALGLGVFLFGLLRRRRSNALAS